MLCEKTFIITGASRGIGRAIALKLSSEKANIVIASKSEVENEKLGGTIYSVADEIHQLGGNALPIRCDIRSEEDIINVIHKSVEQFGGIDGVINNASAISLTGTENTDQKRFNLLFDINVRGTYLLTKHAIPYLKKSVNPHIVTLSPPLNITPEWLAMSLPYSISKFNMSMLASGWAQELKQFHIASNTIWPVTTIATAAVKNIIGGKEMMAKSRTPEILADSVHYILSQDSKTFTGQFLLDEDVLKMAGITNLETYAVTPGVKLQKDIFL